MNSLLIINFFFFLIDFCFHLPRNLNIVAFLSKNTTARKMKSFVNVTKSAVIKNQIRWVNNTLMLEKTYWFKHILVVSSSCFEICEWHPFKYISENMQQTHFLLAFNLHLIICIQKDKIKMYMMHIYMHCGDCVPEACPESVKHLRRSFLWK